MIKDLIKRLFFPALTSDALVSNIRARGGSVGEGTYFYVPSSNFVDMGKAMYIEIGKNCKITRGVIILAHDYSYSVCNDVYGTLPQNTTMTIIGDNVFLGMNAILLPGCHIGNNVIVGAGAVVSGILENNSVYAGNPACKICTLDEFYKKRMNRFEDGAILQAKRIKKAYGRNPTGEEMHYYAQLFCTDQDFYVTMNERLGNAPKAIPKETKYKSLDDFLERNMI